MVSKQNTFLHISVFLFVEILEIANNKADKCEWSHSSCEGFIKVIEF